MTAKELIALLRTYHPDSDVKLCVLSPAADLSTGAAPPSTMGGGDVTIEPSEDWSHAIVIFADAEEKPS